MDKVSVKVDGKIIADGLLGKKAGVTYVPLQAVADTLGASVEWDSKTKTA
ncbi:hypothetical protein J2Z69_000311 [Paenibacillus shirakamiensis]|uniref:Copper amine oxidase-like N-terminal domain-containing protein n=1 Tax=Paenibacillus shirakamiensis TaxID=1265935 RepID=A0ABS4JC50_9BACL|nr:stalk domain-containing protein [Paenibacillus shirakamiensis]MBP1999292.1 hypothetical protein [Paenibacillus shirakamiensis]